MNAKQIVDRVNMTGVVALTGKSEAELKQMICTLAEEFKTMQVRHTSATMPFHEPMSRTEWSIADYDARTSFVWVMKSVTTHIGTDDEHTEKTPVLVLDRSVAENVVAQLNTQVSPVAATEGKQ